MSQPKPIKYTFDADTKKFGAGAKRIERDLEGISKQAVITDKALDMDVDVDDGALTILKRRLIEARAQLERDIEVDVDLDAAAALRKLNQLDRQIKQVDKQINIQTDVDREHLQTSMEDAVTGSQGAAQQSGGLLGLALAVGVGNAMKGVLSGILSKSLTKGWEDAAGSAGALKDELDRMREFEVGELFPDFNKTNRQWAEYEANARKIGIARDKLADDGIGAMFDRETRAGLRASGGLARVAGSTASLGAAAGTAAPPILAAAAALAALAAASVAPGIVGGGIAAGLTVGAVGLLDGYDKIDKGNRKAKIVFGDNLKIMQEWAEGLSANVGIGEKEIVAQSSAIQDLLVPQGFSRRDASELTKSVYERGAALAEFSGLDTAQGVEAVNNALLGQRKQLKGMGVDITAKEVKERVALLKGQKGYEKYNDKMLASAATLSLIEEKSGDAWTAFETNSSAADAALDSLNSTLANLKTDAIEGFGGILADIVGDFGGLNTEALDLAGWIDQNSEKIRAFFLDLASLIADGAISALDLSRAIVSGLVDSAPAVADFVRIMGQLATNSQITAGAFLMLNPLTRGMGVDLIKASGSTRELADSFATAYENGMTAFGPDVIAGIDAAKRGVEGFKGRIEDLKTTDAIRIALMTELDEGSKASTKEQLKALSADQLTKLLTTLDPQSKDKSERQLAKLAEKRLTQIYPSLQNYNSLKEKLDALSKDRFVTVTINGKTQNIPRYLARPDLLPGGRAAMSLPTPTRSAYARGGTDGAWLGGGGSGYLAPRRQDQTNVSVYLDSKQIASYMQPAGSATEPRTRRP